MHAASLGALLLQHPTAQLLSAAGAEAALALLAALLQHLVQEGSCAAVDSEQLAALLLLPLLQQAAFGGSKESKQWACHAMSLLRSLPAATSRPSASSCSATQRMQLHGTAATVHIAEQLLARLWQRPLEAQHWLASLRLSLAPPFGSSSREEGSKPSKDQQQLDRGTLLVASALLQHPSETVQRAALRAVVAAMAATPLLGLSLLPLIVHQLQHQVERFLSGEGLWCGILALMYCCRRGEKISQCAAACRFCRVSLTAAACSLTDPAAMSAGKVQRPQRQLLELLRALAEAGCHPAALPFVLRTLQPLLSAGGCDCGQMFSLLHASAACLCGLIVTDVT